MASAIVSLMFNATSLQGSNPWTQTLRVIAFILLVSMAYAVVVMAIDTPIPIIGHSIGLVYTIWLFSISLSITAKCSTGILGTAVDVLIPLPNIGFLFLLIIWFAYQVQKKFINLGGLKFAIADLVPTEYKYVRMKLRKPIPLENAESDKTSWFDRIVKLVKSHMYKSDPTFRYSTRMLVTAGVTAVCVWQLAVIFTAIGVRIDGSLANALDTIESALNSLNVSFESKEAIKDIIKSITGSYFAAVSLSSFITLIHLFHLLACYRKHMKRLYRGDRSFLPAAKPAPVGMVTAALRYSGYQVAYAVWGWVLLFLLQFLAYVVIVVAIKFKFISVDVLLLGLLPSITFALLIFVTQFLLAKFLLLHDRGAYVNINNRRLFHILSFFLFFYNTLIGLFSCLRRIFTGMALGTVLVDRLDRSTLPRGWESFDPGFRSYMGYLLLEHTYSNPYLSTFLFLLQKETARAKLTTGGIKQPADTEMHSNSVQFLSCHSKLMRNKWMVAYTLINNPSLLMLRNRSVDKMAYASLLTRSISLGEPGESETMSNQVLIIEDDKET
jgi:hypothetical protein